MKQSQKRFRLFLLIFYLCLNFSIAAIAAGDSNIDGSSGSMGGGTKTDVWYSQDGVRITVVTTDGTVAANPFDLTNSKITTNIIHFGKISKIHYTKGASLQLSNGSYGCSQPEIPLPRIVSSGSSKASVETIRRYFCSEYTAEIIAAKAGIPFNDLTSGAYKLLIEPIAYFKHGGVNYAMTATEAALFNQKNGGSLRSKLPSLTHQNLPLSLFLETADLGYPAWSGTTGGKVSDPDIISALGIGIVSYKEVPEEPAAATDYTYRVDTDVITSITLASTEEVNPKNPASATFQIGDRSYTVNNIVMPAGGSQLVWVKWHTPPEPATLAINVTVEGARTGRTSFTARVISLDENPPPDPMATDTYPGFSVPALPSKPANLSAAWSVWSAEWQPDWRWVSDWQWEEAENSPSVLENPENSPAGGKWVDHGCWEDFGRYAFTASAYSASLSGSMVIQPDDIVPTAQGKIMCSGYGLKESATAQFGSNAPSSHYAPAQNAVSYFPEFRYGTYWRLLSCTGGNTPSFEFKENEYSTYSRKVHFSPLWYPDGSYTVYTYVLDGWTPVGMLSLNLSDSIQIQDSLYDDWFSKRE